MKIMGGYDFPGSNSNIDLNALTGWIPERLAIRSEYLEFNKDTDFERMFERFHSGDCLITLATGALNKAEEQRTGLVPTHAYACLDIRKFKVMKNEKKIIIYFFFLKNLRLFQIKNPWSHLRWKGNFSELDVTNWTSELISALNYDPHQAYNVDNGVFWIDYDSLLQFFDVFYISWDPKLFPFTNLYHRKWSVAEGPAKDRYTLGENPQYVLKVKSNTSTTRSSTWILLTRHIVDKEDFAENKEYIALVVYKNGGKRIYYPSMFVLKNIKELN
jgi:calpain-7